MRCFIGIDLPIVAVKEIQKIQKKLEPNFTGRLTSSENLHLTLKFLGEIEEDAIDDVKKRLSSITHPPFELTLKDIGVFSQKFIKIIWVKVSDVPLQPLVDNYLKDICLNVGANIYIFGEQGINYADYEIFKDNGIEIRFQKYQHPVYKNAGKSFFSNMSIIDLLFNEGASALRILKNK